MKTPHRTVAATAAILAVITSAQAQTTVRASTSSTGIQANGDSPGGVGVGARISGNGRYVVFKSMATNLTSVSTNGVSQIFRKDLQTGQTLLVSVGQVGQFSFVPIIEVNLPGANGASSNPWVSEDGRFVSFTSYASNLVYGDLNGVRDVFVRDMKQNTTALVSINETNTQGNLDSDSSSMTPDGQFVVFRSLANKWGLNDTNGDSDIFVKNMTTGELAMVSVNAAGTDSGNGYTGVSTPEISADGRYVAFTSRASNLVVGDTNGLFDVFRRDLATGTTILVSVTNAGAQANNTSFSNAMSADGQTVAFSSYANNLVAGDTNVALDVFVRNCLAGTTERVSLGVEGGQGNDASGEGNTGGWGVCISGSGRYVAFQSVANNLTGRLRDNNQASDLFVRDRLLNSTTLASATSSGKVGNNDSTVPSISADGLRVMFASVATNLVSGDTNGKQDVFVRY